VCVERERERETERGSKFDVSHIKTDFII